MERVSACTATVAGPFRLTPPGTVPSYIQHVIHPVAKNGEDERELLLRFGRVLAEISLAAGDGPAKARQEFVRSRVEEAFPN